MNSQLGDGQTIIKGLFFVISAPSGTGKTSICRQVLKMFPHIRFSVSYTTRPPRPGEVDGKDYHFISKESFKQKIDQGEFAEWAENYGNFYGTSGKAMEEMLDRGLDVMLDVEPRGAKALKEKFPGGVFVFILPPTLHELKTRLSRRGFENPEIIQARFMKAVDEIKEAFWYDYIIFNDKLKDAIEQLSAVYVAEKCRRHRLDNRIRAFLEKEGK